MDYQTVPVGDETIRYYRQGEGGTLLHGFGVEPWYFRELFGLLSKRYDVVAPAIYGLNYLRHPPTTVEGCAALTLRFCEALGLKRYDLTGHSLGGAVALIVARKSEGARRVVLLNPLFPVNHGRVGFALRGVYKHLRAMTGVTGGMRGVRFGMRVLKPFGKNFFSTRYSWMLVDDIIRYSLDDMRAAKRTLLLYAKSDEYFGGERHFAALRERSPLLRVKVLPRYGHDWPIFQPERAAKEITQFLSS